MQHSGAEHGYSSALPLLTLIGCDVIGGGGGGGDWQALFVP